jgi:internalin A
VRLGLEGCQRVRAFAPLRPLVEELDELLLRGCGCRDLPPELFPAGPGGNAAGAVRGYYRDLAAGDAPGLEVRVFVLGNGGVGKTKLCLRLRDEPYATPTDSTHGVRVHDLALRVPHPTHPVRAHLWDFGGQDVYHGSHALFLGGPAVLLVLWHPDAERDGDRPLPYWLDYAAAVAGRDHVVLVAQARADRPGDDARVADAPGLRAPVLAVSGATDRGLSTLRAAVEQAVGDLLAAEAVRPVGRTWAAVRARLRADRRPFLTRDEFGAVCDECGVAPRDEARDDLLAFFDDTGVVIHRPGVWPDRVILDKEWALGAIYTLLDRVRVLPVLRENGRFTRLDLADLAWQQRAVDEQRLFLAMMQECGICFQIGACDLGAGPEPLYVAPELLPTAAARGVERFAPKEPPAVTATARFRFLHDGVLRSVLAGVGQRFGEDARYWRWGCFIDDGRTGTCARVDAARGGPGDGPGGGTVTVRAWGSGADDLANWLRGHVGRAGKSAGGEEPDWAVVRPAAPADGRQEVAISYAHGDDRDDRGRVRREFVGGLEEAMRGWGYVPRRDVNELANCGLIRDFVKTVGRSGRVVLVLSRKYLRSVYCMSELHAVYQRSLGDAADFADRVVPCVLEDDLGIDGDDGRCDWADHWQREYDRRYGRVKSLGKEDLSLWHDIGQWVRTVGDMLAFVSNIATTWGHEALAAEGYAAVRAMLDRPARGA